MQFSYGGATGCRWKLFFSFMHSARRLQSNVHATAWQAHRWLSVPFTKKSAQWGNGCRVELRCRVCVTFTTHPHTYLSLIIFFALFNWAPVSCNRCSWVRSKSRTLILTIQCSTFIVWCTNLNRAVLSWFEHCRFPPRSSHEVFVVVLLMPDWNVPL